MSETGRLLIRATNWIGDTVMSLAAIRELRRLLPRHSLTVAARPWVAGILQEQDLADRILELPNEAPARAEAQQLKQSGPFDVVVLFPNSFATALASWLARIPRRFGYARDGRGVLLTRSGRARIRLLGRHQVFYYLDLLFQTGLSPIDYLNEPQFEPDIRLKVPPMGQAQADNLFTQLGISKEEPLVVINPGAFYGTAKRWFPGRYARTADQLVAETGAQVILVGSEGELPLAQHIAEQMRFRPHVLTGATDLPTLLAVIGSASLFITNDSGPMHLAAALDVPQVALFGSTDEKATGPLSSRALTIHKHVACSPCLLRECPIDLRCFDRIGVDEVVQTALKALHDQEALP